MKKIIFAAAMAASMLVACGGGNNNATSQAEGDKANETKAAPEVKPEKATFDMETHGKLLVDYMKPTFTVKEGAINPALHNDETNISFVTGLSPENFQEYKDAFKQDDYAKAEGYAYKELKIGEFNAVMCSYVSNLFGTQYNTDYYIDFGKNVDGIYGMKCCVSSEKSMDKCTSQDVMNILSSMREAEKK